MKHARRTNHTYTRSGLGLALLAGSACGMPAEPRDPAPSAPIFELSAYDARGRPAPLDSLPRRPEFTLSSTRALETRAALVLFHGPPDSELIDDLAALPLRAAHDARRIIGLSGGSLDSTTLRFQPRATLGADDVYTLALPGSTHLRGGPALNSEGPAFVAELRTAGDARAGATWLGTLPADGASGVPPNLRAAFVALDGVVTGAERGLWIEGEDELAVPIEVESIDCAELETRAASCLALTLAETLAPGAQYRIRGGRALVDARGAPIDALDAAFTTGPEPDVDPPVLESLECLSDEHGVAVGCVLLGEDRVRLRLQAREPVRVVLRSGERQVARLAPAGSVALELAGLVPDAALELELRAIDDAGNASEARVPVRTLRELATLSISEVRADPAGPEPAQEYVEIWNFGAHALELAGVALAEAGDARPTVIEAPIELASDARALLVAQAFDETSALDLAPPPGTRLIRVGASLTRAGLANAGEQLFLRDSSGNRLSAVPLRRAPGPTQCLQRLPAADPRDDAAESFSEAPCTPGR